MKYWVELPEVWATEFLENDPLCDGYWVSSLTQSWQKGYPDNCTLPWTNYVDVVRRLRIQTDKKIIVDVDMLYNEPSIAATIAKELYEVGCNTIVVESKRFPKVNSLFPDSMNLSSPEEFARLLNKIKRAVPEIEVIARIEYLAISKDVELTYNIAKRTLNSGADGVIIHWGGDNDTALLKETLRRLKDDGVMTGVIPTKYLDQLKTGDFDEFADFAILGNICSSYIRHEFSQQSVQKLLDTPCMFEHILNRVNSHEPEGHDTLIVLGARKGENGRYLLEDTDVVQSFLQYESYYRYVFVVADDTEITIDQANVDIVRVTDSLGEVHSLSMALEKLNTEMSTVAYADIEAFAFSHLDAKGLLIEDDKFAGVMSVPTDLLITMTKIEDPGSSILMMGLANNIKPTIIK